MPSPDASRTGSRRTGGIPWESTVEITLSRAYSYFLSYLAAYVWSVVDPAVVDKEGDEGFPLKDAGTGPWRFTEFDASSQVVMEPNSNHYGGVSPSIVKVVWPFVTGPTAANTALNMYKQDNTWTCEQCGYSYEE